MKSKLITVTEAAALKSVSRSAIYKAIEAGRLKSQRVLGKVALREDEVLAWQPMATLGRRKGTPMSDVAKKKLSESQKRRWKQRKS